MSYYIIPKINNWVNVNPKNGVEELLSPYISSSLFKYYKDLNEQIKNNIKNNTDIELPYDEVIKIVNPYEYIFSKVPGSKFSVSKLKPQSNIFYDLYEIVVTLNIFELYNNKVMKTLHVSSYIDDSNECIKMLRENYDEDEFLNFNDNNDEMYKSINNMKFDFMFFYKPQSNINLY